MKNLIISTRFYSETWFQETFVKHYLKLGANQIRVYCVADDASLLHARLSAWIHTGAVIILPLVERKVSNYQIEWETAKLIYHDTLCSIEEGIRSGKSYILAFPDHDEFIEFDKCLFPKSNEIRHFRTIFYEWYLHPIGEKNQSFDCAAMLDSAINGKLRGKVLEMWDDPFYKDYIYEIDHSNFDFYVAAIPMGGFHRLIVGNKVWGSSQFATVKVNHLKGIPMSALATIMAYRCKISDHVQDDWIAYHFRDEYKQWVVNYLESYSELRSLIELEQTVSRLIWNYDPKKSVFDNVIVRQNLDLPTFSRPSLTIKDEELDPLIQEFVWKRKNQH